jgi:hypothetical protein
VVHTARGRSESKHLGRPQPVMRRLPSHRLMPAWVTRSGRGPVTAVTQATAAGPRSRDGDIEHRTPPPHDGPAPVPSGSGAGRAGTVPGATRGPPAADGTQRGVRSRGDLGSRTMVTH